MLKIKKDSIIFKLTFYNTIAIITSSVAVAIIIMFITFQDMESKLLMKAREKSILVEKAHKNYVSQLRSEINYIISDYENNIQDENLFLENIKNTLIKKYSEKSNQLEYAISDKDGNILSFTGEKDIFKEEYLNFQEKNKKINQDSYYFIENRGRIYSRVLIPYMHLKEKRYIIISFPLGYNVLNYIRGYIELASDEKIFVTLRNKCIAGDFSKNEKDFLKPKDLILLKSKKMFKDVKIDEGTYYIDALPVKDSDMGETIGHLGVGVSREGLLQIKIIIGIFIGIMVISLIVATTTIFTRVFKRMLSPLEDISTAAKKISQGDYDIIIDSNGIGEIKDLEISIKAMLEKLAENQRNLKIKNRKLKENLRKINVIEELILGIHAEENIVLAVEKIINSFVADTGLGFSRGMFFRYSREKDMLVGEYCSVNSYILDTENHVLIDRKNGFEFQVKQLKDIISLINIPFSRENFISNSLKNKEIYFTNDKGYKHDLGNDLFNSLGLSNYIAIPVYNIDYYSGVMLFDYYTKEKVITEEDVELIKILMMNVNTKLRNKLDEEEKIEEERNRTINKIMDKFLDTREDALSKLMDAVKQSQGCDLSIVEDQIKQLEGKIKEIKASNRILRQYSNPIDRTKFEGVNLEALVQEVVNDLKELIKEEGNDESVIISLFISYTGEVLGNRERLKRAFKELLLNAYESVLSSHRQNKKINLSIIRDKQTNKIKVEIKDNGIGMTDEQLKYIHQPFITYKKDSAGLGIPLANRVIKDCKGVMKFHSIENEGTEIKITLNRFKEEK